MLSSLSTESLVNVTKWLMVIKITTPTLDCYFHSRLATEITTIKNYMVTKITTLNFLLQNLQHSFHISHLTNINEPQNLVQSEAGNNHVT